MQSKVPTPVGMKLGALALTYFALGTAILSVIGLIEPIASDLNVPVAQVSYLVTVFAVTYSLAAPACQFIFWRSSERSLLLTGTSILAVGVSLTGVANTIDVMFAARISIALGAAAIGPVLVHVASSSVDPSRRAWAMSRAFSGMIAAMVIGVPVLTWIGSHLSWRCAMALVAVTSILAIGGIGLTIDSSTPGSQRLASSDFVRLLGRKPVSRALCVTVLCIASQYVCYTLLGPFLKARFSDSIDQVAVALFLFGIGSVAASFWISPLGDRLGATRMVLISMACLNGTFFLMMLAPHRPVYGHGLVLLWAVSGTVFQLAQQHRMIDIARGQAPLLLALNVSAVYIGVGLGATLSSLVASVQGYDALPVAGAILQGVALVVYLWPRLVGVQ